MILSTYSRLPPPGTDGSARLPNTTPTFTDNGSLPQIDAVAGIGAEVVNKELTTDYNKGPLNPVAMLPPRLVKKILNLEFVEIAEISSEDPPTPTPGHPPIPPKKPVQDISVWVEKFSTMAAILCTRFPNKAPELFAYMATIVKAERNFDNSRWVSYDRCYRREALAMKSLDWSLPNSRLYNEAFTGHAKSIPRCSFCLVEDHLSANCPQNPSRTWFPWLHEIFSHQQNGHGTPQQSQHRYQAQERCNRYNEGRCRQTANTCRYTHKCVECWGPHPAMHCPRSGQRSRSPHRHQPAHSQGRRAN